MLTNKVFLRKTKRGNVLKIVREHYLRDDIFCGSQGCKICDANFNSPILADHPESPSSLFAFPHYLVLDTNVVLDQIHILEEPILCDIIILQTVLGEVKHRSSVVYKKLLELLDDPNRRIYTFVNEHHKDTYTERTIGETANDCNDRAIRVATDWYDQHLALSSRKNPVRTVLLTDDADNRAKARQSGLNASSVEEYVRSLVQHPELQDKLAHATFDVAGSKVLYPPHLTPTQIHDGIKAGTYMQGSYQASRENYLEGSVNVEGLERFVLIVGRDAQNRAVDGDIVAVEMLPEQQWSGPSEIILHDDGQEGDGGAGADDEAEILRAATRGAPVAEEERQPSGRIVGIIRRKWRQYCGILQPSLTKGSQWHMFVPAERKVPKVRINTRQAEQMQKQRIIVAIDTWPIHSRYPVGHFVRSLGPLGDKNTENEVLLIEHDVPHSKFSEDVLSCLPAVPWHITPEELGKRVDLRDLTICSVDPPGCTDIDDALHCRRLPNGRFECGVHIADVTHFVRPNSALDKEAASRGTTVYLVDKRIDMVPELLSSNLCSLRGNVERLAFSCVWEMDDQANVLATRYHKSVIKSRRAMTYEEAQLIIDDASQQTELATSLRQLNSFAKLMKERRMERGALVLASPEIRFQIDSETHEPLEVETKKVRDTNSMVEEFMLLANVSVAERIDAEFPEFAMLRRHPEPAATNFEPLVKAAAAQGFAVDIASGRELARSLDAAVRPDNVYFNTMLRILATRCMMQAVYFISGTLQASEYFHYGLAAPIYTHFTSPIRRYADIVVHRLLAASIGADSTYAELLDKRRTSALCNNLNYRNRMAQYAGRASVALNTHMFFSGRTQEEAGYVLFVRKNALQILIPKFGLEGTIYVSEKKKANAPPSAAAVTFTYNEEDHTQECNGVVFRSFDAVTVRLSLDTSNVQHEKLVLQLVQPYIEGFSVPSLVEEEVVVTPIVKLKHKAAPETGLNKKKRNK